MVSDAALPQLTDDGALLPLRCGQRVRLSCNPDCGDSFTMNNEVAVVVGAAGAIGSVITEQLVTAGLVVVAVGRDADKLQQLAQRHDDMVIPCVADIASDAAIAVIGEQIKGRTVAMVVHAPGVPFAGGGLDVSKIGRSHV